MVRVYNCGRGPSRLGELSKIQSTVNSVIDSDLPVTESSEISAFKITTTSLENGHLRIRFKLSHPAARPQGL